MAAGTVTITEERLYAVKKITFAWTSGTGADSGTASGATTYTYVGNLLKVVTVPGSGAAAPSDDYDITLTDEDSVDVANAQLLNRDEANTEWVTSSLGCVVGDKLTINVTNAGDANTGTCIAYIGVVDNPLIDVDVENALFGGSGIATWPAAAAPADGVSIAEGLRYVVETQLGTLANSGGTATIGGILGDVANSSVATRLGSLAQQAVRTTAAKAIASIASANLFTVSGGPVRVLSIVGQITTGIEAAENNTKLTHTPTGGAAVDLCGTADLTGAAIRKVIALDGVKATALQVSTDVGVVIASALHMPIILTAGTVALSCSATTTGAVSWYLTFEPMAPGATVAAA